MITVFKFNEETEEKCRLKCLDELDVYNNEILTKEYEEDNQYIIEAIKKCDIVEFVTEYIKNISKKMGIESKVYVTEDEGIFSVKINSDNNAVLIGKDGKTLSSMQYLLRQTISNNTKFNVKVNLDISKYKEKKEQYFERDIKKIINDLLKTKDEIKLDPMNSYKRRLVHSIASEYYNIETESFGEEPERYVVIRYVEK